MAPLTPAQIVATLSPIVGRIGAAGIAGNLQQESSDNPGSAGGGLAQWQGARYTGLLKYAQSRGLPATSAQAALGYLAQDLKGPYSGLAQQLRQSPNPAHAADLFSNIYERPGTPMIGNRERYAQQALGAKGGGAVGAAFSTLPASGISSVNQRTTRNVFDQKAFNQANARYIAGSFLQQNSKANPYGNDGPSPLVSSGLLTTKAPNPQDYMSAQTTLQKIVGSAPLNQHPQAFQGHLSASGYTNPISGATIGRTDMGVDASMKAGAPIRALGDSKVVAIQPNWYKEQPKVVFQLLSGPQKGKFYYIAEAINPNVRVGQTVRAGQQVGSYNPNGTGLELGWNSGPGQTLAQATTGYTEGQVTPAGQSFRNLLNNLG